MFIVDEPDAVVVPPSLYHTVMPCADIIIRVLSAMREEVIVQLFVVERCRKGLGDASEISVCCQPYGHRCRAKVSRKAETTQVRCDNDGVTRVDGPMLVSIVFTVQITLTDRCWVIVRIVSTPLWPT